MMVGGGGGLFEYLGKYKMGCPLPVSTSGGKGKLRLT